MHNVIQNNDDQQNDISSKYAGLNDITHNDITHNDTGHNDTRHYTQ